MANKSVYDIGGSTPRVMLKRILFLFLLSVIYLTLVEAQDVIHTPWGFKHLPAQVSYFKESDIHLYLDYRGNVWISSNANGEWKWKEASGVPKNSVSALYVHPFSNDKAYILTTGTKHYKTSDKGESWQEFTTEIPPVKRDRILSFHAHREDFLLFRGTKCDWIECTDVTYYTIDGFSTSKKLLENTDICLWAHSSKRFDEAPDSSIFCIQYDVSGGGSMRTYNDYRLVESEYFFDKEKEINIIDFNSGGDVRGVVGLAISQEYLVAAVKDVNSLFMKMYVSTDGQTWARAFFPFNGKDQEVAYTLIESPSANHLIIDVYSSGSSNTGHLFISNSNGTYFVNRLNHTNRDKEGLVDFEHSLGVDGILLANIVSNYEEIDDGSFKAKKLQSKISFDDGITWKFIKPPEKNSDGTNFPCDSEDWEKGTCSLHLHSVTTPSIRGRMYSANAAPGVLMGVGNVGKYLLPYDQCDTFLSYDGGLTWKVGTLGAHMYGIGHYGSILVMVDDEQPTDYISYSYDRGETWKTHSLKQKIRANKIITNPESTSKDFILFGSAADHDGNSFNKYFAFKLDFSKLFNRDCNENEFDVWIAKRSESNCFMGKKTSYYRRKADARCFVSKPPEPENEICPCTEKDFECAPNYIFDKANEKCIPLVPERIPDECKDGRKKYLGDSGYRIIPENLCDPEKPGAVNLADPVSKSCSEDHSGPPLYGEISHRTTNYDFNSYFYFPESSILMIKTNDGKVKRSADGGTTWEDVLTDVGPIAYMFLHDHDSTKAYFFPDNADNNNYYMWYTTNRGESFDKTKLENEPNKLNLPMLDYHPKNYDWLLYMASTTCPGCHSITYFSSDNGKTWKQIETWAEKCIFGKDTEFSGPENDVVFCSSFKYKNSQSQDVLGGKTSKANPLQLVKLKTDGTSKDVLLNNVVQFFIFNEFMAVATEEHGQLLLHMSKDGKQFSNAAFPPDIIVNKQAYTILQSTTGSVFLDVYKSLNFGYEYGSLFKSNSNGTAFNKILDNTNRNYYGNVDFEKVQGLDGIILANQVENVDELGGDVKKKVTTVISHDDGFRWKRLTNVKTLDNSDCQDCHLNLYGRTEIHGPGGIFSAPSAIGLLIGVGNFGSQLSPYAECNTFMSRDGGRTWTEIRRGPSLSEFGDQGTIIVIVDDSAPTNHVLYSWNYGNDWAKYIFTNSTPVRVTFLTTNSNSTSMKFLLLGRTVPTSARESTPVTVTIDFSQLEKRKCGDDDFESWNPMDENSKDHKCLLGEEITYQRRKDDVLCHIREYEIKPAKRRTCSCTKHDFECAFGYWRNATGGCELMGPDPDRPANCKNKYKGHSGYVKMEKSKCTGGLNLDEIIDKDCTLEGTIISKMKVFDYRIMDHFYFNETKTILVRTMDNIVWKSVDEGYTWEQVKFSSDPETKIYAIFQHPYFNKYAYFITLEKTHFYTPDSGVNFYKLEVPMKPNLLRIPVLDFHPEKPDKLIYTGGIDCEHEYSQNCHTEAFYTLDNGKNWKSLETYVRICTWARDKNFKVDSNLIFCESFRDKRGSQKRFENNPLQFVLSTDFFKTKTLRFENIVGSATFSEFMVVAELLPNGQSLRLWVSVDAENFAEAQFPPNMPITQKAYTVLESITNSVILHVTTSTTNKYGNILKSNGNGTYYSLSLENANRDDRGYVDFEKMQGIQGIALANIVSNTQEVIYGHDKKLKSMITFNDGATWKLLKRPELDSDGREYKICNGLPDDNCSLHLHSYTERRDPKDTFSSSSAIGLMMGVGNVGDHLTPYLEGDTFLTRDAGFTWKEVKKGAYMYEFGDQGAIILLVDDEQTTDTVLYSLDEGGSWSEYKFAKIDKPIRVFDIDTMPGGSSSKFILRGYFPQSPNNEVVVYLDFTNAFTRICDSNDFEPWSPGHDDQEQNKCLFGHTITYQRKKQNVQCFIKDDSRNRKERGQNCVCTEHDFECDYNYMRNATGECELVPGAQPLQRDITEQCANGEEFWYELSGYRKLKVSTCEDGPLKYTGESHRCPGRHSALFWIIIVLSPFVIVGILTYCIINRRYSSTGRIRLGSSIEANSILSSIADIFYQIRMPRFVSRLWSKVPLPGRRNSYYYSPVATDDGHEVLMDDYDQDNETL